ncbi:33 kDa ribonucleoprotein, chloroplastic [Punica granatum]|uniref:Protein gar2 n=2 Tax=Punica granatum TaxID=22663 RepID=A0A218WCA8_PUNGR|nr:33 kDa ribonucleoprotein, chloroplastic [Punica granatum]OWM70098.1 hypothetical protein CDL15_Pgr025948 [Punica granatum]PKI35221.1 hypothetical protein CRG98_044387 [Punica granatum]
MVLSNKKLKQKLRAALAESIVKSESATDPNNDQALEAGSPNPQPQSLKQLLDSSTQKPRLSKREKRRIAQSLKSAGEDTERGNGGIEGSGERTELEQAGGYGMKEEEEQGKKKKKDKKRKRDGEVEGSDGHVKEAKKKKKKQSKKTKKKNKKKNGEEVKEKEKSEAKNEDEGNASAQNARGEDDSQTSADDARKVYAGGIPYYSTEDDIRSYFESCGTITEVDCMTFPESGKFRGIAIISFKTDAAAKRALALDGSDMGGLFLKIQPYKATRPNKTSTAKTSNFAPPVVEGYNRVYVGNLSWDITEEDLKKFLSGCNISSIRFGMDKETGEFRGYAHVGFSDNASTNMAIKLDQKVLCGRSVKVTSAISKKNVKEQPKAVDAITDNAKVDSSAKNPDDNVGANNSSASTVVGSGKMRRRTCYLCGEKGHISSACPKNPGDGSANPNLTQSHI